MSARPDFKGDYKGFTYNNIHSSELGIVRTSDGSRFNQNLLPTVQDKTVQVPGGDGMYFFGSYYTQKQFTVPFAFDSLGEEQMAKIKQVFGDKQVHQLFFDETPYKIYNAKVTGTATIKYIPFAEGENNRLYKGEGSIQFTCYEPFARCVYDNKALIDMYENIGWLEGETLEEKYARTREILKQGYPNIDEWWAVTEFRPNYNFGDVPVSFTKVISSFDSVKTLPYGQIDWSKLPSEKNEEQPEMEVRCLLNTKTGLVLKQAWDSETETWNTTNELMNEYVTGDLTAKIPAGAEVDANLNLNFTCLFF